jgi:hypothetical protein
MSLSGIHIIALFGILPKSSNMFPNYFDVAASESASDPSVLADPSVHENGREARTWSFRAYVCLRDGQTFSNLLDSREKQLKNSLASASVISWASAETAQLESQDSTGMNLEGFVHASTLIRLGSLTRVLPEGLMTDAGEIIQVSFEEVKTGSGKHYMWHPAIKAFLEKTSLDPLASNKRLRVDYRGSSASNLEIIRAQTWFGRGTMNCSDPSQVEPVFRSGNVAHRQEATLGSAEVITFACIWEPDSTAVQVEVLVHSSKTIRRSTLEAWLDPAQNAQIVKFEWDVVQTGKGRPYTRDQTVRKG